MLRWLWHDRSGAAAAEMALMAPLLIVIMFGAVELGNYFYCEHVVVKAVRDGARYASRRGFSNYDCSTNPPTIIPAVKTDVQNVTRTNQVASGGTSRLPGWTSNNTVSVESSCVDASSYNSFFDGLGEIPVVKVRATVPYASIFGKVGFSSIGLTLYAESEAPVMGA